MRLSEEGDAVIDNAPLAAEEIEILTWSRDLLARVKETKAVRQHYLMNTAMHALNDVIEIQPAAQAVS
jgi:hypothetical protein